METARANARAGDLEGALAVCRELAAAHPEDPRVHFELGCALDRLGREAEAIPAYRTAIDRGLTGDDLASAWLQLGTSLRNVGALAEAVDTLRAGCERYPDHDALRVFLALSLHSAGRSGEAVAMLIDLALARIDTPTLRRYARALRSYAAGVAAGEEDQTSPA